MDYETLYCVKAHTYDKKWRVPGDEVQVRKNHSKVLILLGRMSREPTNVIPFKPSAVPKIQAVQARQEPSDEIIGDEPEKSQDDVRAALRAEYKAVFGKDAHGRMSVERMREEIDKEKGGTE